MFQPKKILVPIDFSDESSLALDWGIMLAGNQAGSSLYLCHVLTVPMSPLGPEGIAYGYLGPEKKAAEERLQAWRALIPKTIPCYELLGHGRPAVEIIRLAEKHAIDLMLLAAHGRQGFSRLIHGSVTGEVVRLAPCPVLVLHMTPATVEAVHQPA